MKPLSMYVAVSLGLIAIWAAIAAEAQVPPTSVGVLSSLAGNVSLIQVNVTDESNVHWQGYVGNISSTFALGDSNQSNLFTWANTPPVGQVFASNTSTVIWANISCVNLTTIDVNAHPSKLNWSLLEDFFNMTYTGLDGFNETFNYTFTGEIQVGTETIDANDNCPLAYMNVNNTKQASDWEELLLSDNVSVVFTAIIQDDTKGYDGETHDFQFIVAEDPESGTTDYYLFVELT